MIQVPWTKEQVDALNAFQEKAPFHPFTCEHRSDHFEVDPGVLVATETGWECPYHGCGYMQFWASQFMADPHWIECKGGVWHSLGKCLD